jgi:group I intron endonuclease
MLRPRSLISHLTYGVSGIYAITDTQTGRVYIGQAACIKRRISCHLSALRKGVCQNRWLQRTWSVRPGVFSYTILEECTRDRLTEREQHWIDQTEDVFNKARKATPGPSTSQPWTEERRRRQSEMMRGNTFSKGHTLSPEKSAAASLARRGKRHTLTPEVREARSRRMAEMNRVRNHTRPQNQSRSAQ